MKPLFAAALLVPGLLVVACQSPATAPVAVPPVTQGPPKEAAQEPAQDKAKDKEKAEQQKAKRKELRGKQRELEAANLEHQVAAIDQRARQWSVDAALEKTAADVQHARKALATFLEDVKPRELEEKKIGIDQAVYQAEHAKDELGELEAMYQADEFAKKTKELVLKRGRRSLEMAERSLAVARKENAHFEQVGLPERERELRQRIADVELERRKAEGEAEKCKLELEQARKKQAFRIADLQEEIAELEQALAEGKS
ncbi:MAG: hypothetical protein JNK15_24405 [Planctomycetes bacterium]|nr:hypothetical protein [Planctomycetota bacterium]